MQKMFLGKIKTEARHSRPAYIGIDSSGNLCFAINATNRFPIKAFGNDIFLFERSFYLLNRQKKTDSCPFSYFRFDFDFPLVVVHHFFHD
jgi:hypothetical protein